MLSEPEAIGRIVKIDGDFVEISIPRSERCKACGICPLGGNDTVLLRVKSNIPLKVGERVRVRTEDRYVILSAFILYIIPVIALIGGYFLGGLVSSSEVFRIVFGFLFMGISFWVNRFIDKKVKFPQVLEPVE